MMSPVSVHAPVGLERSIAEAARAAATAVFGYGGKGAAQAAPGLRPDQRINTAAELARANQAGKATTGRKFRRGDKMQGTLLDITV